MMFNIAICEDSKNEVDQLNKYLIDFQFQNNIDINKEIFETAEKLRNSYQKGKYHILFLDIELPGVNDNIKMSQKWKIKMQVSTKSGILFDSVKRPMKNKS